MIAKQQHCSFFLFLRHNITHWHTHCYGGLQVFRGMWYPHPNRLMLNNWTNNGYLKNFINNISIITSSTESINLGGDQSIPLPPKALETKVCFLRCLCFHGSEMAHFVQSRKFQEQLDYAHIQLRIDVMLGLVIPAILQNHVRTYRQELMSGEAAASPLISSCYR